MNATKKERLCRFLEENPEVEERIMSIIDLSENAYGTSIVADDVEERLIGYMQQLGNGVLVAWANKREAEIRSKIEIESSFSKHAKKNYIGKQRMA